MLYKDVSPPIIFNTIEYKAWQAANFPYLRTLLSIIIKMLRNRLDRRVLKFSKGLYRNLWFLVKKKKPGEYKLINSVIYLNIIVEKQIS